MIPAFQKDDVLLADVTAHRHEAGFRLWWLGQSGYLLQFAGKHALIDPYLSDSLTVKYAATDKPHVRMSERVVDPGKLSFVDVVSSSHNHTDHFDPDTLLPILASSPDVPILVPMANVGRSKHRLNGGGNIVGLDAGQSITVGPFTFHAVPAAHPTREQEDRHDVFLGYVVTFGPHAVYHSGDTLLYDGMVRTLRKWKIEVALLPINGDRPERRVAGNLDGKQAAQLARDIGAGVVIPCHYDMFEFNTEPPDVFIAACETLGQSYAILRGGERFGHL
jgi:L-ascorbate metabolism protein UlaG (beta-lactamase superfamily)